MEGQPPKIEVVFHRYVGKPELDWVRREFTLIGTDGWITDERRSTQPGPGEGWVTLLTGQEQYFIVDYLLSFEYTFTWISDDFQISKIRVADNSGQQAFQLFGPGPVRFRQDASYTRISVFEGIT